MNEPTLTLTIDPLENIGDTLAELSVTLFLLPSSEELAAMYRAMAALHDAYVVLKRKAAQ